MKWREPALRQAVITDGHAPGEYRADAVRNLDAWCTTRSTRCPGGACHLAWTSGCGCGDPRSLRGSVCRKAIAGCHEATADCTIERCACIAVWQAPTLELSRTGTKRACALADLLQGYARRNDVVVLALPRGGVPVGYEVARGAHVPLDVLLTCASSACRATPSWQWARLRAAACRCSTTRSLAWYAAVGRHRRGRGAGGDASSSIGASGCIADGRPLALDRGRTVILVDDGLATGSDDARRRAGRAATPRAAAWSWPRRSGARDTCEAHAARGRRRACACSRPDRFVAVGAWYLTFSETSDDEVHGCCGTPPVPAGRLKTSLTVLFLRRRTCRRGSGCSPRTRTSKSPVLVPFRLGQDLELLRPRLR